MRAAHPPATLTQQQQKRQQTPGGDVLFSVLTPTMPSRRPELRVLAALLGRQTFPLHLVEWIVVSEPAASHEERLPPRDTTEPPPPPPARPPTRRPIAAAGVDAPPGLRAAYVLQPSAETHVTVGYKRNVGKRHARGAWIVHMDDDDYYAPGYLQALCAIVSAQNRARRRDRRAPLDVIGATEVFVASDAAHLLRSGPFAHTHSCAGALSYSRGYAARNHFAEGVWCAEEPAFLLEARRTRGGRMHQLRASYELVVAVAHARCTVAKDDATVVLAPSSVPALPRCHARDAWYLVRTPRHRLRGLGRSSSATDADNDSDLDTLLRTLLLTLMLRDLRGDADGGDADGGDDPDADVDRPGAHAAYARESAVWMALLAGGDARETKPRMRSSARPCLPAPYFK